MLRAIGKVWLWTAPFVLFGCDDGGNYYDNRYVGYVNCEQFTSCGECTPVLGCGWCTSSNSGRGICLPDPDLCREQEFSWTWESQGCGVSPDAGTTSDASDAGGDVSSGDGGASCHWPASADTFSATEAGISGCLPSTGGDLCSSSQYTLACYGTSTPDAALNCTASPVTGPANVAFSCCPCAP